MYSNGTASFNADFACGYRPLRDRCVSAGGGGVRSGMLDVVIRGGTVIDGTGSPGRKADVAIQGDRIVQIGDVTADAPLVIDAADKVVTPGFVDVHTHYDAQVFWDGALTPSP